MEKYTQLIVNKSDKIFSLLEEYQQKRGYLNLKDLETAHQYTGVPLSQIYSAVSFYPHFRLKSAKKPLSKPIFQNDYSRENRPVPLRDFNGPKVILSNLDKIHPETIGSYIKCGGYHALLKAALEMNPEKIIKEVKQSQLVGRGGGGFPTGLKWAMVFKTQSEEKYLVVNAEEGEPGTFKDKFLLERNPHLVLEGAIIAALAVGAKKGYIFINPQYSLARKRLEIALKEAQNKNFLGKNILGSDYSLELEIYLSPGGYVNGEETALFECIEGKISYPRVKPPFPSQNGIFSKPTLINNVETLANVSFIINNGGREHAQTKLFSVCGAVKNPGVYEAPLGIKLKKIIYDYAGGLKPRRKLKAILLGGASGFFVDNKQIDLSLDYSALHKAKLTLGSGAIIVFDDKDNMKEIIEKITNFFAQESCGKCVPCRIGTVRLEEIIKKINNKTTSIEDLGLIKELTQVMKEASLCGVGQTAPNPILSGLKWIK